jgi:hypothetical protein
VRAAKNGVILFSYHLHVLAFDVARVLVLDERRVLPDEFVEFEEVFA